jgi:hypothetical protein
MKIAREMDGKTGSYKNITLTQGILASPRKQA